MPARLTGRVASPRVALASSRRSPAAFGTRYTCRASVRNPRFQRRFPDCRARSTGRGKLVKSCEYAPSESSGFAGGFSPAISTRSMRALAGDNDVRSSACAFVRASPARACSASISCASAYCARRSASFAAMRGSRTTRSERLSVFPSTASRTVYVPGGASGPCSSFTWKSHTNRCAPGSADGGCSTGTHDGTTVIFFASTVSGLSALDQRRSTDPSAPRTSMTTGVRADVAR